jgi:2Fe-2S ferredoxin
MVSVRITNRSGEEIEIEARTGRSLMEAIRSNDLEDVFAVCGGCCSCATCHVQVDPDYLDRLTAIDGDEDDLLDSSYRRTANSRLSCQLKVTNAFEGMRVTIAPAD